jgi:hypothetical protein
MIKRKVINGKVFIEQTTFYIYPNEEALQADRPFLITSNKTVYNKYKTEEFNIFKDSRSHVIANVSESK